MVQWCTHLYSLQSVVPSGGKESGTTEDEVLSPDSPSSGGSVEALGTQLSY